MFGCGGRRRQEHLPSRCTSACKETSFPLAIFNNIIDRIAEVTRSPNDTSQRGLFLVFCLDLFDLGFVLNFQLSDDRKDAVFYRLRVIVRDFVPKLVKGRLLVGFGGVCRFLSLRSFVCRHGCRMSSWYARHFRKVVLRAFDIR